MGATTRRQLIQVHHPEALLHPQFSLTEADYHSAKGKGMARGSKGKQLAVGSSFRNSVLYLSSKGHWYVKKGITISLPALMMLGSQFTAARLYRFWCQAQLLVEAARQRYQRTGYWGWGRG